MKKQYPQLASLILNKPVLCTQDYADTILSILGDKLELDVEAYSPTEDDHREQKPYQIKGGVATIPILGSMTHRASFLDAVSGIQSYQSIQAKVDEALSDPSVNSIMLEMDSPGGTVAGAFDLRDYIMSIRGQKPIHAFAHDLMASAAYLIGSACDKVYTSQTGKIGSIGVIAVHVDKSEAIKDAKVKPTIIKAGEYKDAGTDMKPLDKKSLEYLQKSVDDSYEMFVSAVAKARGIDAEEIRATEARVYGAKESVELGLTDGIKTYDSAVEELSRVYNQPIKGKRMATETNVDELAAQLAEAQAEVTELKGNQERIAQFLVSEGYEITPDGVTKPEAKEQIEVNGQMVNKADIPAPVLEALETAEAEKAKATLEAKATEKLPSLEKETAVKLIEAFGEDESMMSWLASVDAKFDGLMEENGESDIDGSMSDPKIALDRMVAEARQPGMTHEKAYAEVAKTKEGMKLITEIYKENK